MEKISVEEAGKQFAALPFRIEAGNLQVLLITSRESRRSVIPKGWPIHELRPREAATSEALEEAGLVGRIVVKRLNRLLPLQQTAARQSGNPLPRQSVSVLRRSLTR
jgi:hypothetical protein